MVKISLQIKATLENIKELYTCHPDFSFYLKIKCLNCGEVSEKWHDVTESDAVEQSKHSNNFVAKCKLCTRENSLDIISDSNEKFTGDDENKFQTIVTFDCRGLEPIDFDPNVGWIAKVEGSPSVFRNIDLSEKEWVEYDTNIKKSVGIYDFQHQFVKVK